MGVITQPHSFPLYYTTLIGVNKIKLEWERGFGLLTRAVDKSYKMRTEKKGTICTDRAQERFIGN